LTAKQAATIVSGTRPVNCSIDAFRIASVTAPPKSLQLRDADGEQTCLVFGEEVVDSAVEIHEGPTVGVTDDLDAVRSSVAERLFIPPFLGAGGIASCWLFERAQQL
jgi:hypothetical protein